MNYLRLFFIAMVLALSASAHAQSDPFFSVDTTDVQQMSEEELDNALRDMGFRDTDRLPPRNPMRTHRDSLRAAMRRYSSNTENPQVFDPWMPFSGFRYNKVDGLFLGAGSSRWTSPDRPIKHLTDDNVPVRDQWRGKGGFGYSFGSHFWTIELGLSHLVWLDHKHEGLSTGIEIGAEGHIRTDTRDSWLQPVDGNTMSVLFAHEDNMDYFKRKGFSVFAGLHLGHEHLSVTYRNDDHRALNKREYWSFFGGRKMYSENAPIEEGTYRSVVLTSFFDNAHERRMYVGTQALLEAELGLGDHPHRRYTLDLRRYQPIMYWFAINARVRATAVTGENIPPQDVAYAGGISTIPAYDPKEFVGNRMVLVNAEAIVNGRLLDALLWFPRDLAVIVSFDAGATDVVDPGTGPTSGWNGFSIPGLHSDAGVGVGSSNGAVRLGLVWRSDRAESPRFVCRIARPF